MLFRSKTLKTQLKVRGLTYKDLARELGQSESNLKRVFSEGSFSLRGLEAICEVVGIELLELAQLSRREKERQNVFSRAQETVLAGDEKLFSFLYLILSGFKQEELISRFHFSAHDCARFLLKLDKLKILSLRAENKFRFLISKNTNWLPNGPLNDRYRREVGREFLDAEFLGADERLRFLQGRFSRKALKSFYRRVDRLLAEFSELSEGEVDADEESRQIWLCVAYRPWRFSLVNQLKRKRLT